MGESLDVTLDSSAVHARRWTQGGWLDASAQSIRRVDFVLDHSYFKEPVGELRLIDHNKKVKGRLICKVAIEALVQNDTLLAIDTASLKALS